MRNINSYLKKSGFVASRNAKLIFKEEDYLQESFIGQIDDLYEIIHYEDITYIESFGHNILLHTKE